MKKYIHLLCKPLFILLTIFETTVIPHQAILLMRGCATWHCYLRLMLFVINWVFFYYFVFIFIFNLHRLPWPLVPPVKLQMPVKRLFCYLPSISIPNKNLWKKKKILVPGGLICIAHISRAPNPMPVGHNCGQQRISTQQLKILMRVFFLVENITRILVS